MRSAPDLCHVTSRESIACVMTSYSEGIEGTLRLEYSAMSAALRLQSGRVAERTALAFPQADIGVPLILRVVGCPPMR